MLSYMHKDLIGSTEAARILDIDKATLTRWVASGRLVAVATSHDIRLVAEAAGK